MSYQALARKWRPRRFSELVGQEHVVRALTHALDSGRMHHAFLFTGTRGVGKTTIARILAKSLNCERGPTSDPCGQCSACVDVDAGRFVDLLEIDAASNTGVDNVRDLIDSAMYAPSRGRYKVYLIDEVHMLSKAAFNALLKTLEEPPPHVKFLLATTDPEKLLVTVLSRCIKFNLKRLTPEQIGGQLERILAAEEIPFEADAIEVLARAADGSLRDGLSLLDQAIAHGGGRLSASEVHAMLGTVERSRVRQLLEVLAAGDGMALLEEIGRIAEYAPDFGQVLDELAALLHRLQLLQLVPAAARQEDAELLALAGRVAAEDVQLWYQMAVTGRRDLPLAPTPRVGFEMALLRMLAFVPEATPESSGPPRAASPQVERTSGATARSPAPAPGRPAGEAGREAPRSMPAPVEPMEPGITPEWSQWIARAGLRGPVAELARHVNLVAVEDGLVRLAIKPADEQLRIPALERQLQKQLGDALGREVRLRFEAPREEGAETPAEADARLRQERQRAAERSIASEPLVKELGETLGARVVAGSVRPLDAEK